MQASPVPIGRTYVVLGGEPNFSKLIINFHHFLPRGSEITYT